MNDEQFDDLKQLITGTVAQAEKRLSGNIADVEKRLSGNIANVETNLADVEKRLSGNIANVETSLVKVENNLARVEDNLVKVENNLTKVEGNLANVETNLADVEKRLSREIAKTEQRLFDEVTLTRGDVSRLRGEMQDGFAGVGTAIDGINQLAEDRDNEVDKRFTKLKQFKRRAA